MRHGESIFLIVARVEADGRDVAELVIERGLAAAYQNGETIKDWCE